MQAETVYSIPLAEACEYTRRWRERGHTVKAFAIDVAELNDVINEIKNIHFEMKAIRVYFGYKEVNGNLEECLVLVGLDDNGNDITGYMAKGTEHSGTYDFTRPCPDTCDTSGSPLLND
ncbi:MAG TPA: hypothetical protein VD993_19640 [Chitinophagaceae bacterium]|nr:hypothetical protein [Chitinophagaceae bacterium]